MLTEYNIYIDIDSVLDFRLKAYDTLGFNAVGLLEEGIWYNRLSDSLYGVDTTFLYNFISSDMPGMFTKCFRTNILPIVQKAYAEGCRHGINREDDMYINLDIDMKSIALDETSKSYIEEVVSRLIPSSVNVSIVNSLEASKYNAYIMYDSALLVDALIALDVDYMDKVLYTPFLLDRLYDGIKPGIILEQLEETIKPFINIEYLEPSFFSVPK